MTAHSERVVPPGAESTIDQPAPYRELDWISKPEWRKLHPDSPIDTSVCDGYYVAPRINPDHPDLDDTDSAIKAAADRYETDADGTTLLSGDVIVQQGKRQLESDVILINRNSKKTELQGNVRIRQEGILLSGDSAKLNLNDKQVEINEARYLIHENKVRGEAKKIYNDSQSTLTLEGSSYTTCEPNSDAWKLKASEITLNQASGWGTASHVVLNVQDWPVFYIPWITFPIDDRRQSGFLFPSFSSNDDSGFTSAVPIYLNLAPNYDATLIPRSMSKRGEQLEAEFRYLNGTGEGEFGVAYLDQDQEYDLITRKLGLWRHEAEYGNHLKLEAEYTRVSDQDYFRHLDTSLNASSHTHLDQYIELSYDKTLWNLSAKAQSYQTLDRLISDEELPYRKLPQVQFNGHWPSTAGWQWLMGSEYVRFEHPDQDISGVINAERTYVAPGLQYRFSTPGFFATPTVRYHARYYDFEQNPAIENAAATETNLHAALEQSQFSLDTGLVFERDLSLRGTAYRQTLEPRLFYLYTADENQNELPVFDTSSHNFGYNQLYRTNRFSGIDRISNANQISLGLSSAFVDQESGRETFRASVGQIYYFEDRTVQLNPEDAPETADRSAIASQFRWIATERMTFTGELNWDENSNNVDSGSTLARYQVPGTGSVSLGYRYYDNRSETATENEERIDQTDFTVAWRVANQWTILGRWRFDLENHRSFDNLIGVEYESCCWSLSLVNRRYLEEGDDDASLIEANQGIFLEFQLKGLGGVGNKLDGVLKESILGLDET